MKRLILLYFLSLILISSFAQTEHYRRVVFENRNKALAQLHDAHISIDLQYSADRLLAELSDYELALLDKADIEYKILISDIQEFYINRNKGKNLQEIIDSFRKRDDFEVPQHFRLGSMAGFCTWSEINAEMDSLHNLFPELVSQKQALPGTSVEGRHIYWQRISDHPEMDEDEPEILYNALIHAREPGSMQQLLYFMFYLVENYNSDTTIRRMLDHTELYFILCINPDGYVHNEQTFPEGGGMWRKNRRINYNNSIGVDPNRNFGYMWGYDDYGSSPVPTSQTYRGDSAFSEPETRLIRDFAESHDFNIVMNYHSYGNLLLHPWGYISYIYPDDYLQIRDMAAMLTRKNHFSFGQPSKLLYLVNGDATDWFYSEQTAKPGSISFTPEVGSDEGGFWPAIEDIIPQCESCLEMNLLAAQLAGSYASVIDAGPVNQTRMEGFLKFGVRRTGLSDLPYTVSVKAFNDVFDSLSGPLYLESLPDTGFLMDSVYFRLKPGLIPGDQLQYVIRVENDAFANVDTITKVFGPETTILQDEFDDSNHWSTNEWALRDDKFTSPQFSMSNVAGSYYPNSSETWLYLNDTLVQPNADAVWINFTANWDLDGGRDYIGFLYSTDYGITWTPLKGRYSSRVFNGVKLSPVYEGLSEGWVDEWVLITGIRNVPLQFGFRFTSDEHFGRSGFYCDDFRILTSDMTTLEQIIAVDQGWTGFSTCMVPAGPDLETVFGEHFDQVEFLTTTDSYFQPGNENNTLTRLLPSSGFMIKSAEAFTFDISGYPGNYTRLSLHEGWNLVSIPLENPVEIAHLQTDPQQMILAIKEACGIKAWWPEKGVYEIQQLEPGKSYFIKLSGDAVLIFE